MAIGVLLDPVTRTATEIVVNDIQDYYNAIGCNLIDCVQIDGKNDLWVDDEGLLKDPEHFVIPARFTGEGIEWGQPLAGRAIVLGHDGEGDKADYSLHVGEISLRFAAAKKREDASGAPEGADGVLDVYPFVFDDDGLREAVVDYVQAEEK